MVKDSNMIFMSKFFKKIIAFVRYKIGQVQRTNREAVLKKDSQGAVAHPPSQYAIGITNICNLQCPLCITGIRQQKKAVKHMNYGLFTRIIDKIRPFAKLVQLYKWGEPLLHEDLIKMLEYCNRFDLNTEISTNFSLKNMDDKIEAIVKHRLKRLIVSFDGVTQEGYSRYRKGGDLSLVLRNIQKLSSLKKRDKSLYPRIILQYLRNKYTTPEILQELKRSYAQWGADEYVVCDMTGIFKDKDMGRAREWFSDEDIKQRPYLDIDRSLYGCFCPFLYDFMVIEQDGSIPACCFATDPAQDFGHWDDNKTILEMYNSELFRRARSMFIRKKANQGCVCTDCGVFLTYALKGKKYD